MKIILILFLLVSSLVHAEEISYGRSWAGLFQRKSLSERWTILGETQLRYSNEDINLQQILVRPGVMYRINTQNEVGIVYGYVQTGSLKEHRPTIQWLGKFSESFSTRARLEIRKWEEEKVQSLRLRPMLRYEHSIEARRSWVVWDEPFLNVTHDDLSGNRIFERNRFFTGLRLPFENVALEVGYLNQTIPRQNLTTIEHIFVFYVFI